jgi:ribosomal protein S6--L-glutamate ligase
MRIAILSSGSGWHVSDLVRAAAALGHDAIAVDFRRVTAGLGVAADSLGGFDAVLVRTMPPGSLEQVVFRMDVLHRLQAQGVYVLNPPAAVETCVDKYLASARLQAAGLPVPPTAVCQHADAALDAFTALGGDVVVKPLFGSEGRGIVRVADPDTAWRVFRTLERMQSVLYLQQFVRHPGWDLRAFVMGGRVLASMRRLAGADWRTNVAQGGRAEPVQLTSVEEELALRASTAVGAAVAGVDLLPGPDGIRYVIEVNAVPGWRALAPVSGVDVAAEIIRFVVSGAGRMAPPMQPLRDGVAYRNPFDPSPSEGDRATAN